MRFKVIADIEVPSRQSIAPVARLLTCVAAEILSYVERTDALPTDGRHEHSHAHYAEWTLTDVRQLPRVKRTPPTCAGAKDGTARLLHEQAQRILELEHQLARAKRRKR